VSAPQGFQIGAWCNHTNRLTNGPCAAIVAQNSAAKFACRGSQPALIPLAIKSLLAPSLRTGIGSPSVSNPRGRPRHKSAESSASSFALLTILFRSLVACSHAAIFVGIPESFPTLLIASLLVWIFCFVFFFHI
jgi:hypothetical protein